MANGEKFDGGKPRHELIPPFATNELAKVLTFGAKNHGDRNWESGIDWTRILASIKRHTNAIELGEDYDIGPGGSGLLHAAHIMAEASFLTEYYKIAPDFDDRPIYTRRIGLDIDDVVADFVTTFCTHYDMPIPKFWHADYAMLDMLSDLPKDFWVNLPLKTDPDKWQFEPVCYVTSRIIPQEWTEEWITKMGLPTVPVVTVGYGESKLDALKHFNVEIFVDDKYDTFRELNKAGIFTYLMTALHNERYSVGHKRLHDLYSLR